MADVKVKVLDNGPLLVEGTIEVVDAEGNTFQQKGALCRCGLTANAPFCNGAHAGKFENAPRAK
ncbi:CDGSH iron-sulfur domain-containing protein [Chengkuizengella axinellae]|uniref:CDGSH iron-sulfur domain-containing protein n=1 Tax=Chengkuizengella axinellae TaxID=3064388 RepID=A0ABT9IY89_9BACL|nr:CDGSH iron-sulfur domain-containing protein [Chengkuizengella sp. 2205SS18-9]MDP5274315.1 CDGSH iron-sulfur domain-containing protein [Chengkuizengella sp. 2205SS18-9]